MNSNFVMEILVFCAILGGPFLGIWAQGRLEAKRQAKDRKLDVFKTLMATRATPLSQEHVHALNRIDIEFRDSKKVRNAWNILLNHFGESPTPPSVPAAQASRAEREQYERDQLKYSGDFARWIERVHDLRTKLLMEMGALLDYEFNEVHVRKGTYNPRWQEDLEMEGRSFLKAANEVFTGQRWLPMYIVNWPQQEPEPQAPQRNGEGDNND